MRATFVKCRKRKRKSVLWVGLEGLGFVMVH